MRANRSGKLFAALVIAGFLTGCAADFNIRKADPLPAANENFAADGGAQNQGAFPSSYQAAIKAGVRAQRAGQSSVAAGYYLSVLEDLSTPSTGENSLATRRFATARLVELCAPNLLANPRHSTLTFNAPDGAADRRYRVSLRRGAGPGGVDPKQFIGLVPTDRYAVSRVPSFSARTGEGATFVGALPPAKPFDGSAEPRKRISGLSWSVTAVPVFGRSVRGTRPVALELYEPHDIETVCVESRLRPQPLAADFTTPLVSSYALQKHRLVWLTAFLRGDEYLSNAGLYPTEAPSTTKTPVILVHGLVSDPVTFQQLANALAGDPALCRRYQVWVFFYPSSLPVPSSADLLRKSLTGLVRTLDPSGNHPALHRMVLVGHSMGGLLSRLMVSDSGGDTFYRHYFRRPVDDLQLSAEARATMRRVFFFHANPYVRTAVFIATPHRGSKLALSLLGSIGRLVVGLPSKLHADLREITGANRTALADPSVAGENSVVGLSPTSPLVKALAAIPLRSDRARLYSIVGDRGRSGPLATSSDGVVPYASAHLPQASREVVVPASHTIIVSNPATIAEVLRILHERAGRGED